MQTKRALLSSMFAVALYDSPALAQQGDSLNPAPAAVKENPATEKPSEESSVKDPDRKQKGNDNDLTNFLGNFSVGAAVLSYKRPSIETAEFVGADRRVIVTDSKKHVVTPWLQANYFWDGLFNQGRWRYKTTMPGIFAGVGMGANGSFLDTFGAGVQLGFRRVAANKSLNLGIGYFVSTKKELANGIEDGKPLPSDYDQVKLVKKSTGGVMVNLSFGFQ